MVNFGLLGYSFYIRMGYFCKLFYDNAVFIALLCSCYLLAQASIFILIVKTGYYGNPKPSTDFARRVPLL